MPDISQASPAAADENRVTNAGVVAGDGARQEEAANHQPAGRLTGSRAWLFPTAALGVCLFGAGREVWSLGLAAFLIGVVVALAPPVRRLPVLVSGALGLVLLAPLAAFLPASWLNIDPAWRRQLVQEWGIPLADMVSPQPAVTLEGWLVMACLGVWLWVCLSQGFQENHRRVIVRILALGGSLLALLSMLEHWNLIEMPWWPRNAAWGVGFGPFSNRNHISSLCAITAVLSAAAAYDAHRKQSPLWLIHALTFLLPLACIFVNTSRSGLFLVFGGMTVWLATASLQRGFFKKLAVSASLVFAGVAVVMVLGGSLSKRLASAEGLDLATKEVRLDIYRETLSMTAASPWLGLGLGNFSSVFPMAAGFQEPRMRYLHPESDLLWLLSEGGLLTVVPLIGFFVWWFGTTRPWFGREAKTSKNRSDMRLRKAAAIGGLLALLHGLVDVPNHGVGYAMLASVLIAAAVSPGRLPEPAAPWHRWGFRAAALVIVSLGAGWGALGRGMVDLPLGSRANALHDRAIAVSASGGYAAARDMVDRAIRLAPLDFRLYYLRAQLNLSLGRPSEEALADFGRARTIEPDYARFCYDEGLFWLAYDPQMAVIPWREYLRRTPESGPGIHGYYRPMLERAALHPELRRELWKLATTPALKLEFLDTAAPGEEWEQALRELLVQQPDLQALEPLERRRLFAAWHARGNRDQLVAELERRSDWKNDGWRILAEEYARRGQFQLAYQTAAKFVLLPSRDARPTGDIGELERGFLFSPTDARRGLELYYAQRAKGQLGDALVTVEKIARLPQAPTFVKQEMASIYALKQDYRRAWELMQAAITQP